MFRRFWLKERNETGKETEKKEKKILGRAEGRDIISFAYRNISGAGDYGRGCIYGNEPQWTEPSGKKAGGGAGSDAAGNGKSG